MSGKKIPKNSYKKFFLIISGIVFVLIASTFFALESNGLIIEGECDYAGQKKCLDNSIEQICYYNVECECLMWQQPISCSDVLNIPVPTPDVCGYLNCENNQKLILACDIEIYEGGCYFECVDDPSCCVNECSYSGETQCSIDFLGVSGKQTCGDYDDDYCLEWGLLEECIGDTSCGYENCLNDERPRWLCIVNDCSYICSQDSTCGLSCVDECLYENETKCYSDNFEQICGDYDDDFCLEWSPLRVCKGDVSCGYANCLDSERPRWLCRGDSCSYSCFPDSTCETSCVDECSFAHQTQCYSNDYKQTCGDYNNDSCLEWSSLQSCVGNSSCGYENCSDNQRPSWYCNATTGDCGYDCYDDSSCETSCIDECSFAGQTECYSNDYKWTCGYYDSDSCLEWSSIQTCTGDNSCGYGICSNNQIPSWYCDTTTGDCAYNCVQDLTCEASCVDECYMGQAQCSDKIHEQTCGYYDSDSCLEWSSPRVCEGDVSCGGGNCANNPKPSWYCSLGICLYSCYDDSSCGDDCVDECSFLFKIDCFDNIHEVICGYYDTDTCLDWSSPRICEGNTSCGYGTCPAHQKPNWYCDTIEGNCGYYCVDDSNCDSGGDECSYYGGVECITINNEDYQRFCEDLGGDGFLEWGTPILCAVPDICGWGWCSINEKPVPVCDILLGCYHNCYDDLSCDDGGGGGDNCIDECSWEETRCYSDNYGDYKQSCGDYDDDICLDWDWGFLEQCTGDNSCGYENCSDNQRPSWFCNVAIGDCGYNCVDDLSCCVDECFMGQAQCSDNIHEQTCGYYDSDFCLEWSSPRVCEGDISCGGGNCADDQKPSWYCSLGICAYSCYEDSSCDDGGNGDDCIDECYLSNETQCLNYNHERICGDYDSDSCLEWSSPRVCEGSTSCGHGTCLEYQRPNWYCFGGGCAYSCYEDLINCYDPGDEDDCIDECDYFNGTGCFDDTHEQICGNYDDDICLEWSSPQICEGNTSCGYGSCNKNQRPNRYCDMATKNCAYSCYEDSSCDGGGGDDCANECSFAGQTQCLNNNYKQICGDYDGDACLEWSSAQVCEGNTSCGYGNCLYNQKPSWYCDNSNGDCAYNCYKNSSCDGGDEDECVDECYPLSKIQCFDSNHKKVCGNYDSDTCLEWSSSWLCTGDTSCGYGVCNDNQKPEWYCDTVKGNCGYYCAEDSSCIVITYCEDECPERWLMRCVGDTHKQICGHHYDNDSCLEWYPRESCVIDTSCGYGICNDNQRPNWYCDSDTNSCKYDCTEDSDCTGGYVKHYRKDCYEDDVHWFDSDGIINDKEEECSDDNDKTVDVCENSECIHLSEEIGSALYCRKYDHCGDGVCNCDEDIYTCFDDCELINLTISVFAKKESEEEWKEEISVATKEKIDVLFIVLNNSQKDFDNVIIKAQLPQELIYGQDLKIDEFSFEEDITNGINIGFLSANTEKRITFKSEVSSKASVGAETELKGFIEVEDISDSDSVGVTIEKAKKTFSLAFKWLVSRWYIWFLLWILFVIFLYWVLRKSKE